MSYREPHPVERPKPDVIAFRHPLPRWAFHALFVAQFLVMAAVLARFAWLDCERPDRGAPARCVLRERGALRWSDLAFTAPPVRVGTVTGRDSDAPTRVELELRGVPGRESALVVGVALHDEDVRRVTTGLRAFLDDPAPGRFSTGRLGSTFVLGLVAFSMAASALVLAAMARVRPALGVPWGADFEFDDHDRVLRVRRGYLFRGSTVEAHAYADLGKPRVEPVPDSESDAMRVVVGLARGGEVSLYAGTEKRCQALAKRVHKARADVGKS